MTSRAFEELERRCRKMDRKRYARWFLILFSIFALVVFSCFKFFDNGQVTAKAEKRKQKKSLIKKVVKSKDIAKVKQKREMPKRVSQEKIIIKKTESENTVKKAKNFLKKEKRVTDEKILDYNTLLLNSHIVIPETIENKEPIKRVSKSVPKKRDILKTGINVHKKKFNIEVKSFKDEKSLLRDNEADENFETTMKLSSYYFDKSKYQKAIYWSKKANHYKPSSFKPWLIYAKAKIKQHKRSEAIKAVETFLSYFDSDDARKFLIKIKGKRKND